MKLGVCSSVHNARTIKERGFDYIELPVTSYANLDNRGFSELMAELKNAGLSCEASNFFFPSTMKVVGPDVRRDIIMDYCKAAACRARQLGIRFLTIGSGTSRKAPEGFSLSDAVRQFGEWVCIIGDMLEGSDCLIGLEPIRRQSTNILNTVSDCASLARHLAHPRVRIMSDFQQLRAQGDDFRSIVDAKDILIHAHISNSRNLHCPVHRDEDAYDDFFNALRSAEFSGNLSVETTCYDTSLNPGLLEVLLEEYGFERR